MGMSVWKTFFNISEVESQSRLKIVLGGDVSGSTHSACGARGVGCGVRVAGAGERGVRPRGPGVAPLQPVQPLRTPATHYGSVAVLHRSPHGLVVAFTAIRA